MSLIGFGEKQICRVARGEKLSKTVVKKTSIKSKVRSTSNNSIKKGAGKRFSDKRGNREKLDSEVADVKNITDSVSFGLVLVKLDCFLLFFRVNL